MKPELRTSEGRFVKGVSPNPGGVSRKLKRVRKKLEKLDDEMLSLLASLARSEDAEDQRFALGFWGKYRLPVPKETKAEQESRASGNVLPDALRKRLAGLNS